MTTMHRGWACGFLCVFLVWPVPALEWTVEVVADGRRFRRMGPRSLALDDSGAGRLAYGWDGLYFGVESGGAWGTATADVSPRGGEQTALDFQTNGHPCISYIDGGQHELKYAWRYAAPGRTLTWGHESITATTNTRPTHLVVDTSDTPHISCVGPSNDVLYCTRGNVGWQEETVAMAPYGSALALDHAERPCMVYDTGREVRYARRTGGRPPWSSEVVFTYNYYHGEAYSSPALQFDDAGYPHIVFCSNSRFEWSPEYPRIWHVYQDSMGWHQEWLVYRPSEGTWLTTALSIDLTASGDPHVAYRDVELDELWYYDGTAEEVQEVDDDGDVGSYPSMRLNGSGLARISYFDRTGERIKYAARTRGSWILSEIDAYGDTGGFPSLALGPDGRPHVTYYDFVKQQVELAKQSTGGAWQSEVLSVMGNVSNQQALAVNPLDGDPMVVFRHPTQGNLQVAYPRPSGSNEVWWTRDVDVSGGENMDIVFDAGGIAHVSYNQGVTVRYAMHSPTGWATYPVDVRGTYDDSTAISVDPDGNPHVAYISSSSDTVRYARCPSVASPATWLRETVVSDQHGAGECALALDASGAPHLGFVDSGMYYAYKVSGNWTNECAYQAWGAHGDLALGDDGEPRVVFYRSIDGELGYHTRQGDTWNDWVVDNRRLAGWYCELEVDPAGRSHIVFYDPHRGDLIYATPAEVRITDMDRLGTEEVRLEWSGAQSDVWIYLVTNAPGGSWNEVAGPVTGQTHNVPAPGASGWYRLRTN